jgi:hypothetical protein
MALAQGIAANSGGNISYQQAYDSLNPNNGFFQGGNYNFGETTYTASSLDCNGDDRCNGVHFPPNDPGFVHLDTSNPFDGSVFSFLEHSFVDVFLGNVVFYAIPRSGP